MPEQRWESNPFFHFKKLYLYFSLPVKWIHNMLKLLCILQGSFCFVSNDENSRNVPKGRYIWQVGPLGISQIIPPTHMASLGCHWNLRYFFLGVTQLREKKISYSWRLLSSNEFPLIIWEKFCFLSFKSQ